MPSAVLLEGIVKRIGTFTLAVERLDIPAEGIAAVTGRNGAGKSTLLGLIALLDMPDNGTVSLFGTPAAAGGRKRLLQRRTVSLLTQETVILSLSVRENIAYGLRLRGFAHDEVERRVAAVLDELALTPFSDRRATELSGGEARRVAFARAVAIPAKLYLFDEPTAGADEHSATLIEAAVTRLAAAGNTVLFTTHDTAQTERIALRRILLDNGRVVDV